jgi:hypothetical protein
MDITLRSPDDVAKRLSAGGGGVSRRALDALAREAIATKLPTFTRFRGCRACPESTEDFLRRRPVPPSEINEADLDREAAVFEAGSRRTR